MANNYNAHTSFSGWVHTSMAAPAAGQQFSGPPSNTVNGAAANFAVGPYDSSARNGAFYDGHHMLSHPPQIENGLQTSVLRRGLSQYNYDDRAQLSFSDLHNFRYKNNQSAWAFEGQHVQPASVEPSSLPVYALPSTERPQTNGQATRNDRGGGRRSRSSRAGRRRRGRRGGYGLSDGRQVEVATQTQDLATSNPYNDSGCEAVNEQAVTEVGDKSIMEDIRPLRSTLHFRNHLLDAMRWDENAPGVTCPGVWVD